MRTGYVTFLKKDFENRRRRNPRYSMRAYASFLNLDSSALSRILSGKHELSVTAAITIVRKLELSPEDQERFIVSLAQTRYARTLSTLSSASEVGNLQMALRQSEERFRALFEIIDQTLELNELVRGENGHPVDFCILKVNSAWERYRKMKSADVVHRRVSEWAPKLEAYWLELYAEVVATREPRRREFYLSESDIWFSVYVTRPRTIASLSSASRSRTASARRPLCARPTRDSSAPST